MILCDNVHIDSTTGKQTILGTFSTVGAKDFPCDVAFALYYALTDAEGEVDLTYRMVDSKHGFDDESTPIFAINFQVMTPSPLAVIEGAIVVKTQLPNPGVYHCELLTGDSVLMSRRLVALRPPTVQE
jgi:hypothetical protein